MRALILEMIEPGETDIEFKVVDDMRYYALLVTMGLSSKELVRNGVHEFLTTGGAQYRVTMVAAGTFRPAINGGNA